MTTLEAVNEILNAVGEPSATALDTAGTSDVAEAEVYLDRANKLVQEEGWQFNRIDPYEITAASIVVTVGSITGTYQPLEAITQSGSGATGILLARSGTSLYITPDDGSATFLGSGTMTGGTSGATATASAVADVTVAPIQVPSSWLLVSRARLDGYPLGDVDFSWNGTALYNLEDRTATFDAGAVLKVAVTQLVTFTSIPVPIQNLVVATAAVRYQRYRKAGRVDDSFLSDQLILARGRAQQHESDAAAVNLTRTPAASRFFGTHPSVARRL